MKIVKQLRILTLIALLASMTACGARYKGSASDRSGSNGATNGNGKVYTP